MINKSSKKEKIGNVTFIIGLLSILMLNLNSYWLFQKVSYTNYYISAVIMTVVLLCCIDLRTIVNDKMFYFVILINALSVLFIVLSGTGVLACLPLYILTISLYISNKIIFSKGQSICVLILCGSFFFYWTIDVKGYFKGYSINFGGMVLLYGFIFVIALVEYIKIYVLCRAQKFSFLKEYPYYFSIFEAVLFFIAYKIIAYYRSRTAAVALIIFALFLCLPRKLIKKEWFIKIAIIVLSLGTVVFPIAYIKISNLGLLNDREVFYKPLITVRGEIWSYLLEMIKQNPLTGNGTIIIPAGNAFREGLLDTCNGALQLITVHGCIVFLLVAILFIVTIIRLLSGVKNTTYLRVSLAAISAIIVSSYAENSILTAPFFLMFAALLFVANSIKQLVSDDSECIFSIEKAYSNSSIYSNEFKGKFIPVFCVSISVLVMYIILGPLEIFYSNYHEFMYNTSDFIVYFILILISFVIAVTLVLSSLPKIISVIYCTIGLSITIVSYIQYMFINADLVDDNGNFAARLELGPRYFISVMFSIVIPAVIIVLVCILKNQRERIFIYPSLFVSAIMIVAILSISINLLMLENKKSYINVLSGEDEFEFASDENIIVIVLDTFGREALNEELKEDPGYLDVLNDFTYYENTDSIYSPTYPSLVHLLTEYEYEEEDRIFMEPKAFNSDKSKYFFNTLHDNGYKVCLYTRDLIVHDYMYDIADNTASCKITVNRKDVCQSLFKMSLYRYLPYNIKPYFEVYNPRAMNVATDIRESYPENYEFYDGMKEKGLSVNPEINKKLSFCQLEGGLHLPYANDENLRQVEGNTATKHQVMQGLKKLLYEYFYELKSLGIYDKATIIVMADHGENGNTDAIFFKKNAEETHSEYHVDKRPFTYHEFQNLILEVIK